MTYRVSYLKKETVVTWKQLHEQFGADYADVKDFAKKARQALQLIRAIWPEVRLETPRGRLVINPSPPHIALSKNSRR